jgi:hypothetical protein
MNSRILRVPIAATACTTDCVDLQISNINRTTMLLTLDRQIDVDWSRHAVK